LVGYTNCTANSNVYCEIAVSSPKGKNKEVESGGVIIKGKLPSLSGGVGHIAIAITPSL